MKFIDLFCGIGGFHQAIQGECVLACDIDTYAMSVYEIQQQEAYWSIVGDDNRPLYSIVRYAVTSINFGNDIKIGM